MDRRDKRMNVLRVGLLFVVCMLILGSVYRLGAGAITTLSRLHRDVKVAEFGTMEDKLAGQAIVIYKEDVVMAPASGHFNNMVKDQQKISKDALLGYLVTDLGQMPLRSSESGTFMRQIDGLEDVFKNVNIQSVTPEVFAYKPAQVKADQPAVEGQPLYKIVDSLVPTQMLLHFPLKEINFEVKPQQQVKIRMDGKDLGNAVITDMKQDSDELVLMVKFPGFQDELTFQRFVNVEVVFNSYSGYMIPEKALVENDGKKGIYCSNGEDISFKPVTILKTKDGICAVEGLKQNDMYVSNPPAPK
jgi:hypothetical protein